ncbi:MAG: nitrous oxide reductase accessory protein NosL [Geobacteraceae bacterium]|nr:nitrous oxide reductase accessory protein NosL [Geobacteraceae bacterium]
MSRIIHFCLLTVCLLLLTGQAASAHEDITRRRSCSSCGMDRKMYGYSRMLITYADGGETGVCSLHCAVTEMNTSNGRTVEALQVADRNTHLLIPAEKAFWVIGGKKRGVMTQQAKWAFATKEAAGKFVADYGGTIVPWEKALEAARKDAAH